MKNIESNRLVFVIGVASLLIGFAIGGFVFGMIVHENSHVLACLLFGLRIHSYTLTHVVYEESSNPLVNISVRLAGGIGQTLVSLLFFWSMASLEGRAIRQTVFGRVFGPGTSPMLGIVLGFELAFLTVAFHGIANAVWEGFLFESYSQLYDNVVLVGAVLLISGIISFYIIRQRYRLLVTGSKS